MKTLLDYLAFCNIFVSLCAASLVLETQMLLSRHLKITPYVLLVFFATLLVYNLHRIMAVRTADSSSGERVQWLKKNPAAFYTTIAAAAVATIALTLPLVHAGIMAVLAACALVTFFYSFPLLRKNGKRFTLKALPGTKSIAIGMVWGVVTVIIPVMMKTEEIPVAETIVLFLKRSLFVFVLCIPFDIRDEVLDRKAGVRSLPVIAGTGITRTIGLASVFFAVALILFQYFSGECPWIVLALMLSWLVALVLVKIAHPGRSEYFFLYLVDGMMLVQFFLVTVVRLIFC